MSRFKLPLAVLVAALPIVGCGGSTAARRQAARVAVAPRLSRTSPILVVRPRTSAYRVPALIDPHNVYAADGPHSLASVARRARPLIYVPNSASDTVEEIDPHTFRVVRQFKVGAVPQHVVPAYNLRTLWVTNDIGNSLTPINPRTGAPGHPVHVADPYNMYFTPDGRYAVVMAESLRRMDFLDPRTMKLRHSLHVPQCAGVNHADYTADGRLMLVSCEFAARMIVVDIRHRRVLRTLSLPVGASPQDVKLSPDGRIFYVADLHRSGVWLIDARRFHRVGFLATGAGAHGLYPSRDARFLYVSNRSAGTISVISFRRRKVVARWAIPGGGSPDMGGVSANGSTLWLAGRYSAAVYAINTHSGKLIRKVAVGLGPHGVCVWPQPGRYSLGHTGVMR